MDYAEAAKMQAAGYAPSPGAQGPQVPRAATHFAEAYQGLDSLSAKLALLESRVHSPRDAQNNPASGIPITYPALAESFANRVSELNGRLEAVLSEI